MLHQEGSVSQLFFDIIPLFFGVPVMAMIFIEPSEQWACANDGCGRLTGFIGSFRDGKTERDSPKIGVECLKLDSK